MPVVPISGVGGVGIIKDRESFNIPINAWSDGRNVRFDQGSASSYSKFKVFGDNYTYSKTPIGILRASEPETENRIVTVFSDGSMEEKGDSSATDVTPSGTLGTSNDQITTAEIGGLTYVNRPTDVPVYREEPGDGAFTQMSSWDADDRCRSLRAYKDYLVAINVTKGAQNYPGMVKWSNAIQYGSPPSDWDVSNDASLAGETVLNELKDSLVDGVPLGDSFIIFGSLSTYRMDFIGGNFVFNFTTLFSDQGIMAPNCAVTVDAVQYVFGGSDLYRHDGLTKQSIANGWVKDFLLSDLDFGLRNRCFVYHDRLHNEVVFCYPATSDDTKWNVGSDTGCNRGLVFNLNSETWSIIDLPNVVGYSLISQSPNKTWNIPETWDKGSFIWNSFAGQSPALLVLSSSGNSTVAGQPYFLDSWEAPLITNPLSEDVNWDGFLDSGLKDLDDFELTLAGRKLVRSIHPKFSSPDPDAAIKAIFGSAENPNQNVRWGPELEMNPWTGYKYDTRTNGRYVAIQFKFDGLSPMKLSGYDFDLMVVSKR